MRSTGTSIAGLPGHAHLAALALASTCLFTSGIAVGEGLECVVLPHSVLELSSGVSGRLQSVYVDRADRIEAGQIVAELESDVERANLSLAQARAAMNSELRLREASLSFDERQRQRIDTLHTRNAVSNQDKDQADRDATLGRWQRELARERLELAALELERARAQLALRTVRSPVSGVVLERYKSEGEFVDEDAILQVARLDPLRVEVIAPVEMHSAFRAGMQANVFPETAPSVAQRADVVAVDPVADPASGTFRARLELPNPDHALLAGVKCTAELVTALAAVTQPERAGRDTTKQDATSSVAASAAAAEFTSVDNTTGESVDDTLNAPAVESDVAPAAPPVAAATAVNALQPDTCQTLGPIDTLQVARGVARQLRNAAFDVSRREDTRRVSNGYIVLATTTSPNESIKAVSKRVRAKGVHDLAPLARGPFAGRVSLGVYADVERAQRRVNELAAHGIDAEVQARHRNVAAWWLDVTVNAGAEQARLHDTVIEHLPALEMAPVPCARIQTAQS